MTEQQEKQQLFDKALEHIRKQRRPSFEFGEESGDVRCVYEGPDGLGCAARPFILNYFEGMESNNFGELIRYFEADLDPVAVKHWEFVSALQSNHDGAAEEFPEDPLKFMEHFELGMEDTAKTHGLEYAPKG